MDLGKYKCDVCPYKKIGQIFEDQEASKEDVMKATWQQASNEAVKEVHDCMLYSVENCLKLSPESKNIVINMLREIVDNVNKGINDETMDR